MNFLKFAVIFLTFCTLFYWIMKKIDLFNKLWNIFLRYNHNKAILIISMLIFLLLFEIAKGFLDEKYGHPNFVSIIIGAFLTPIYLNLGLFMFRSNEP